MIWRYTLHRSEERIIGNASLPKGSNTVASIDTKRRDQAHG
jgi:hypothetical protein